LKETEKADSRGRLARLEEKAKQHEGVIAVLKKKFTQLSTDFGCFVGEVSALSSAPVGMQILIGEISVEKAQIAEQLSTC
jgi:chaperone required for assembly of F1-ATPase